jgi:hypothetical protein
VMRRRYFTRFVHRLNLHSHSFLLSRNPWRIPHPIHNLLRTNLPIHHMLQPLLHARKTMRVHGDGDTLEFALREEARE